MMRVRRVLVAKHVLSVCLKETWLFLHFAGSIQLSTHFSLNKDENGLFSKWELKNEPVFRSTLICRTTDHKSEKVEPCHFMTWLALPALK